LKLIQNNGPGNQVCKLEVTTCENIIGYNIGRRTGGTQGRGKKRLRPNKERSIRTNPNG